MKTMARSGALGGTMDMAPSSCVAGEENQELATCQLLGGIGPALAHNTGEESLASMAYRRYP
jgi:hypothetical protein